MSTEAFEELAEQSNIPSNEAGMLAAFDEIREQEKIDISNASLFSPFWRFVRAVAVAPALWFRAFLVAQVLPQMFIKTATKHFLDLHAWALGLSRKAAVFAVGNITFSRTGSAGAVLIPAGTHIQSVPVNNRVFVLSTLGDTLLADGETSVLVKAQALGAGAEYNLANGSYSVLPEPLPGIEAAANVTDWLTTPGADEEQDQQLRERCRNQYSAINRWHTDAVYKAIIASVGGISIDNIFMQHNAPRGPGTANAYIMLEFGTPSTLFLAGIQARITDEENHGHGDDLQVMAIPENNQNLTVTVWGVNGLTAEEAAQLLANVEAITRSAFRENADYTVSRVYPQSVFSFSLLAIELHALLPNLQNVAFSLGHITSALELPRLGTLTVNPA